MTEKTYDVKELKHWQRNIFQMSLEDKQWIFGQRIYNTLGECGYEYLMKVIETVVRQVAKEQDSQRMKELKIFIELALEQVENNLSKGE